MISPQIKTIPMTKATSPDIQTLASFLAELPADIICQDQDIIASYCLDHRKLYQGASRVLLRPHSVDQVQQIMRASQRHRIAIVPQGGNTGYCAGATPDANGCEVVLSLEKLNKIREIDTKSQTVAIDAGIILHDLAQALDAQGLSIPFSIGSAQSCRLGGNISTNAGGLSVVRHGMIRNAVLGLEVVLPDGQLFADMNSLRKNNSGYDLKQLFIGAEGTLGVVTGAVLRLMPKPQHVTTVLMALPDSDNLVDILHLAQHWMAQTVESFEYISAASLRLLLQSAPELRYPFDTEYQHFVLIEAATSSPALDLETAASALFEHLLMHEQACDGLIAHSLKQREDLWALRERLPEGEVGFGGSVKHDIAVPLGRISAFIDAARATVAARLPDAVVSVYGHVGDGNIHFNVLAPAGADVKAYKARIEAEVSPAIYDLAHGMQGTFGAEYGIGRVKIDLLERFGDPVRVALMAKIKATLDPVGLMNPNKVVQPQSSAQR